MFSMYATFIMIRFFQHLGKKEYGLADETSYSSKNFCSRNKYNIPVITFLSASDAEVNETAEY